MGLEAGMLGAVMGLAIHRQGRTGQEDLTHSPLTCGVKPEAQGEAWGSG